MNGKERLKLRKIAIDLWGSVVSEGDRPNRRLSSDDPVGSRPGSDFPLSFHINVCILAQTLGVGVITMRVERDWDEEHRFFYVSDFYGRENNTLRLVQFLDGHNPTTEAIGTVIRSFEAEFLDHERYWNSYKRIIGLSGIQRFVTEKYPMIRDRSQPNHEGREEIILQHARRPGYYPLFVGGVLCRPDYYMTEAARHDLATP